MNAQRTMLRVALGSLALLSAMTVVWAEDAKERKPSKETVAKYDANKDGSLDEAETAAWKADIAAKTKATREANTAKYDTNKDGKLDEAERANRKAEQEAAKEAAKAEREAKKAAKEGSK